MWRRCVRQTGWLQDAGDTNGDGSIDFDEFTIMMASKMRTLDSEEEMKEAFKFFDKKGTGFITLCVRTPGDPLRLPPLSPPAVRTCADDRVPILGAT